MLIIKYGCSAIYPSVRAVAPALGKMIGSKQELGYYREKEFDFPHKRAALMAIGRERFFDNGVLY